jgi:hypothetical protein
MTCIKVLMNFQNEIKLHHWGTPSYAEHKALGKLYEGLDPLVDQFAEMYFGTKGKDEIQEIDNLRLNGPSRISINSVLNSFEDFLIQELPKETNHSSLLNIRDEMLGMVQQTKYLLTLS